jgi:hypothetical protein
MSRIIALLPHLAIILSGIFIVFLILDQYNPTMNFVSNNTSVYLLWALSIVSIINAVLLGIAFRKSAR